MKALQLLCQVSILWFPFFLSLVIIKATQSQQYSQPPALPSGWQTAAYPLGTAGGREKGRGWFPT